MMDSNHRTIVDFDIHRKDARRGAEALWANWREAPGLAHDEKYGGYYLVSRFEDVMTVLMNPKLYSSADGITLPKAQVRTNHIPAEMDPPEHREFRSLMTPLMTPARVRLMEQSVRDLVKGLFATAPCKRLARFPGVSTRRCGVA